MQPTRKYIISNQSDQSGNYCVTKQISKMYINIADVLRLSYFKCLSITVIKNRIQSMNNKCEELVLLHTL